MIILSDNFSGVAGTPLKDRVSSGGITWKNHDQIITNPTTQVDVVLNGSGKIYAPTESSDFQTRRFFTQDEPLTAYPFIRTVEARVGWFGSPIVADSYSTELVTYYRDSPGVTDEIGLSIGIFTVNNTVRLYRYNLGDYEDTLYGAWAIPADYRDANGIRLAIQITHYDAQTSQLSGFINNLLMFTGLYTETTPRTANRYGLAMRDVSNLGQGFTLSNYTVSDGAPVLGGAPRTHLRNAAVRR